MWNMVLGLEVVVGDFVLYFSEVRVDRGPTGACVALKQI